MTQEARGALSNTLDQRTLAQMRALADPQQSQVMYFI